MDVEKASEVNSAFSALLASSLKLKPMGNELSASAMVFKSYGDNERNIIVSADLDTAKIFKDPSWNFKYDKTKIFYWSPTKKFHSIKVREKLVKLLLRFRPHKYRLFYFIFSVRCWGFRNNDLLITFA